LCLNFSDATSCCFLRPLTCTYGARDFSGICHGIQSSVASCARGPGQTKRYGPWHVITCSQAHSRLLRNLLNGWCQPRSHCAPRSWPSANIESKSCTTCLGPFVLRKPACARTLICQRHQSQFEGVSARVCDGRKLGIYIYVYIHTYRQEGFELATRPRLLWSPSSCSIKTGGSEL
jgi:hypothetical protein